MTMPCAARRSAKSARRRRPGGVATVGATGAYCYSMSSRYNMAPRPAVVAVNEGTSRAILRRESVEDFLSLEVGNE